MNNFDDFKMIGIVGFDEVKVIMDNHIAHGSIQYTDDELKTLIKWMEETSLRSILLDMALDGMLDIVIDDNEEYPNKIKFHMTPHGEELLNEYNNIVKKMEFENKDSFNIDFDDKD